MNHVVTSFSFDGLRDYAARFLETYRAHWPYSYRLHCYFAEFRPESPFACSYAETTNLDQLSTFMAFRDAYDSPRARGREPMSIWKNKDREAGYSFRTDAMKFCRKVFSVADVARRIGTGRLVWIDADVVTLIDIPADFIEKMLAGQDAAYLGRAGTHSELGFLALDLPAALPLIERWAWYYASGRVFAEPEWHDSFLFDLARIDVPAVRCRNLTPGGSRHVWVDSPLTTYMDHLKGDRKRYGYSPERIKAGRRA